jgi:ArsR family transcriptional regulator, arsenate/arsenite/antimonite-responsive transcriptional repressor
MESEHALAALAALGQPTRLEAFRLLVRHEPEGLAAGDLAQTLAVPANTLSAHLNVLSHAGLVRGERRGRSIVYRVAFDRVTGLVLYLLRDCCGGRAELCRPLMAELNLCVSD